MIKRSPLKRGNSRLKRTPLRRKSKNPRKKLINRADTALQDYYRVKWADVPCEGCGGKMELCHHYVLKSHSNRLRYEEINLIPVCKSCHSKVHGFNGEIVNAQITLNRGQDWLNKIRELEREHIKLGIKDLEEIIIKYKL